MILKLWIILARSETRCQSAWVVVFQKHLTDWTSIRTDNVLHARKHLKSWNYNVGQKKTKRLNVLPDTMISSIFSQIPFDPKYSLKNQSILNILSDTIMISSVFFKIHSILNILSDTIISSLFSQIPCYPQYSLRNHDILSILPDTVLSLIFYQIPWFSQ